MVRNYAAKDFDVVVALMTSLQSYFASLDTGGRTLAFQSGEDAQRYVEQALDDATKMNGALLVAEVDQQVVGFIQGVIVEHKNDVMHQLTHRPGKEGWVGIFVVAESFRGKGIGSDLFHALEQFFLDRGCLTLHLKVDADNASAIGVYKHEGLVPREIVMVKNA